MPLAHGALGNWDELLPILIIGVFAILLVVFSFFTRQQADAPAETGSEPPTKAPISQAEAEPTEQSQPEAAAPDHYRLD